MSERKHHDEQADLQEELDRDPGISDAEGLFGRTAEENARLDEAGGGVEGDPEDVGMKADPTSE